MALKTDDKECWDLSESFLTLVDYNLGTIKK